MNKKELDIEYGSNCEDTIFKLLRLSFDESLQKTVAYDCFDFESEKICIEVKSRRNRADKYLTTMIGYNKIKQCVDPDKAYIFVFVFTDKIMYCKYCTEDFQKFEVKKGGRLDRGKAEIRQYVFIPITYLEELKCDIVL